MKKIHINENNFVCDVFPFFDINENCVEMEVSDEQFEVLTEGRVGYAWKYESGTFTLAEKFDADYLRRKRTPLLEAFDKYKSNVYYGIETETADERSVLLEWYRGLLDLSVDSIKNVPEKIKYYL